MTIIGACGVIAYLLALVAFLPARVAFDPGPRWTLSGTVWNGEALLAGTQRLEWQWSPLGSLTGGAFAANWRLTSAGGPISPAMPRYGGSRVLLEDVSGEINAGLLTALDPTLPFECAATMQVRIDRLAVGGDAQSGSGRLRSEGGQCTSKAIGIATFVLPTLTGRLMPSGDVTALSLAAAGSRRELVRGSLTRHGHLRVAMTSAGTQVLPFARAFAIDKRL